MHILKKILVSSAVSLFVGAANTIGMRAASTIWDRAAANENVKKKCKKKRLFEKEETV